MKIIPTLKRHETYYSDENVNKGNGQESCSIDHNLLWIFQKLRSILTIGVSNPLVSPGTSLVCSVLYMASFSTGSISEAEHLISYIYCPRTHIVRGAKQRARSGMSLNCFDIDQKNQIWSDQKPSNRCAWWNFGANSVSAEYIQKYNIKHSAKV